MLAEAELDVVHVCTPNASHAELSIRSIRSRLPCNVRKPMAKTTEEAKQ